MFKKQYLIMLATAILNVPTITFSADPTTAAWVANMVFNKTTGGLLAGLLVNSAFTRYTHQQQEEQNQRFARGNNEQNQRFLNDQRLQNWVDHTENTVAARYLEKTTLYTEASDTMRAQKARQNALTQATNNLVTNEKHSRKLMEETEENFREMLYGRNEQALGFVRMQEQLQNQPKAIVEHLIATLQQPQLPFLEEPSRKIRAIKDVIDEP